MLSRSLTAAQRMRHLTTPAPEPPAAARMLPVPCRSTRKQAGRWVPGRVSCGFAWAEEMHNIRTLVLPGNRFARELKIRPGEANLEFSSKSIPLQSERSERVEPPNFLGSTSGADGSQPAWVGPRACISSATPVDCKCWRSRTQCAAARTRTRNPGTRNPWAEPRPPRTS